MNSEYFDLSFEMGEGSATEASIERAEGEEEEEEEK